MKVLPHVVCVIYALSSVVTSIVIPESGYNIAEQLHFLIRALKTCWQQGSCSWASVDVENNVTYYHDYPGDLKIKYSPTHCERKIATRYSESVVIPVTNAIVEATPKEEEWGCMDGYERFKDTCYKYYKLSMAYTAARTSCEEHNSRLATIHDEETNTYLFTHVKPTTRVWIGLDDIASEGTFIWSDGTKLEDDHFKAWYKKNPDNWHNEDCTYLYNSTYAIGWNDAYCTIETAFICERGIEILKP